MTQISSFIEKIVADLEVVSRKWWKLVLAPLRAG